jgi:hypothetical protein
MARYDMQGKNIKGGIIILLSVCAALAVGSFAASKWAIRHETLTFDDPTRNNRTVAVDVAARRDKIGGQRRNHQLAACDPKDLPTSPIKLRAAV